VVESTATGVDQITKTVEVPATLQPVGRATGRTSRQGGTKDPHARVVAAMSAGACRALGALGHSARAKMLRTLLDGPATYRALQRVTRLKAGPLYHHVNQLRLAGLILPKRRDLYELTRGGRNLVLVAFVLAAMTRDPRRRP